MPDQDPQKNKPGKKQLPVKPPLNKYEGDTTSDPPPPPGSGGGPTGGGDDGKG